MYYRISKGWTYIFGTPGNLLQEEDVHSVHLWEVGLTLLGEEIIDVPLGLDLLHKFMDVDLLESWILWVLCHLVQYLGAWLLLK